MFDPQCYYDSCRRLTLGQEKLEAMITMTKATEKKMFRRPARVALVAAAMVAALAVTAGAAQLEAVQQFFATVFVTVNTEDGVLAGLAIPTLAVEEREGRTILILDEGETDITDALARDGEYRLEGDGYEIRVDREGVAHLKAYGPEGDLLVSFSTESGAKDSEVVYQVTTEDDAEQKVGIYSVSEETAGSVEVTGGEGEVWNYQMEDGQLIPQP